MSPPWSDSRVPTAERCVVRHLLESLALKQPQQVFVLFADGTHWTCQHLLDEVVQTAASLQALGVQQNDIVLVWLPNGPDALRVWLAINYLGAVYAPMNPAYRGGILEHVLNNTGARLLIGHAGLLPRLADIARPHLRTVVCLGGEPAPIDGLTVLPAASLSSVSGAPQPPQQPICPWDTMQIIYTSGTTGPSKGVLCSYSHIFACAVEPHSYVKPSDRHLVTLPLFHIGGALPVYNMLIKGGSIAMVESFKTHTFWQTVRETRSTVTTMLGTMASFLIKQPASPDDRTHGLRITSIVPLSEDAQRFSERFGCDVFSVFNMTEVSVPLVTELNPRTLGTCGKLRTGVQARLVDENDCEVEPGAAGELVLRTDRPWAMTHGYHNDPAATARAWRNGWFHTGDAFRIDADDNYFFVDRVKDAIRRRGENISSFEVEAEVLAHPVVREAAAIGVSSEHGEQEVLVALSLAGGAQLDCVELMDFLRTRMPHFMVPRYVRVMPELPKTPTQKIQKQLLRQQGITPETWDRERHGLRIKPERLG